MFYPGGPIDNCTHVPDPVARYNAQSEYNAACTEGMDIAHFRMPNNEFLKRIHMCFQNNHLSFYWIENNLSACIIMVRTPNTPATFTEECVL